MPRYLHIDTERYPLTLHDVMQETPTTSWPDNGAPDEEALRLHGYAQVLDTEAPEAALGERAIETGWTLGEDGVYRAAWAVVPLVLEEVREARKAELAETRWQKEAGGVAFGGAVLQTDRESRANLMGAALRAQMAADDGEPYALRWKTAAGFIDLDGAAVIAAAKAAEAHVRGCFDREADLSAALDAAETAADVLVIDITAGWPE